jgi:hypothetical protein
MNNNALKGVARATPPTLSFATSTAVNTTDTTDSTQTVTVQNIGNAALSISALSYATDFPEAARVDTDCTPSTSLTAGGSCTLSVEFAPLTVGSPLSESLVLTDDNLNVASATQSILLSGSSVANVPTLSFASIPSETYGNAPFTISATSASSGAVTYAVTSGPATISGAMVTLTGAGTVVLSASQAASGNYAATTATTSFTVAKILPASFLLTSNSNPALMQSSVTFTATASSTAGTPTWTVNFLDGTTPLGTGLLSGGVATFTTSSLVVGSHNITAAYVGDTNFVGASSGTLTQAVIDFSLTPVSDSGGSATQIATPGGLRRSR